jgi:hypothetical protein
MKRLARALAIASLSWSSHGIAQVQPLPFAGTVAPAADELAVREAIHAKVKAAIAADDFAGLNSMEQDLLNSRARTPSGWWKLALFHRYLRYELGEGLEAKDGCEYRKADFVKRWGEATPRAALPVITAAGLSYDRAWCLRGTGFANEVPADVWPKFHADIATAAQILDRHPFAAVDPEFWAVRVGILRAQGNDLTAVQALLDKATARAPGYYPIYGSAALSFLPQWGGSFAAIDRLARYAAQRSAATDATGFYARVYITLEECGCIRIEDHPDWPTMKQALRDIYAQFPVPWNGNLYATYACRRGDTEEGRRYIRAMFPQVTDDRSFVALFATCDHVATLGNGAGSE